MSIKICFIPPPPASNKYVDRTAEIVSILKDSTFVEFPREKAILKAPLSFIRNYSCDYLVLNWHENKIKNKAGRLSTYGVFKFFFLFLLYKIVSRKIVYVRHNVHPHGMKGFGRAVSLLLLSVVNKLSDVNISHSGHMVTAGYQYVPHPLYLSDSAVRSVNFKSDNYYIVFGRIQRYKKIEDLIATWRSDKLLIVAGPVGDDSYIDELRNLAHGKNIEFLPKYIAEEESLRLVGHANGLLLAHAEDDMVVSGSFFFAATLGVPVFAVSTPFFKWLVKDSFYEGVFVYSTAQELVRNLPTDEVSKEKREVIREQAIRLFGEVSVFDSWNNVLR